MSVEAVARAGMDEHFTLRFSHLTAGKSRRNHAQPLVGHWIAALHRLMRLAARTVFFAACAFMRSDVSDGSKLLVRDPPVVDPPVSMMPRAFKIILLVPISRRSAASRWPSMNGKRCHSSTICIWKDAPPPRRIAGWSPKAVK